MAISTKRHGRHKITVKFAYRDRSSFLNLPEVFVFSTSWTGVYSSQRLTHKIRRKFLHLGEQCSESDFAVSDGHIWNTITHKKPREISRDLRLVTDWSRNLQRQFSFRFLIVGGQGEKK